MKRWILHSNSDSENWHRQMTLLSHQKNAIRDSFAQRHHVLAAFFQFRESLRHHVEAWHHLFAGGGWHIFLQDFSISRKFRDRVGTSLLNQKSQLEGYLQGSIRNVTVVALAIKDIVRDVPKDASFSLYADDITLCYSWGSLVYIQERLQTVVNQVSRWNTYHVSSSLQVRLWVYTSTK